MLELQNLMITMTTYIESDYTFLIFPFNHEFKRLDLLSLNQIKAMDVDFCHRYLNHLESLGIGVEYSVAHL